MRVVKDGGVVDPDVPESTSNCNALEAPPPGAGVWTVTAVIPAVAMSDAGTWADRDVALRNCVVSALLPQYTVEVVTNPVPFTVRMKEPVPEFVKAGERLPMEGVGIAAAVTVSVIPIKAGEPDAPVAVTVMVSW